MQHRRYSFVALALAAGVATSVAHARPELIEIQGRTLPRLSVSEGQALKGDYLLADGRQLTVSQRGRRLWAAIDHGQELPMQALSAHRLQSADGKLTVDFIATSNGEVNAVLVKLPPRG